MEISQQSSLQGSSRNISYKKNKIIQSSTIFYESGQEKNHFALSIGKWIEPDMQIAQPKMRPSSVDTNHCEAMEEFNYFIQNFNEIGIVEFIAAEDSFYSITDISDKYKFEGQIEINSDGTKKKHKEHYKLIEGTVKIKCALTYKGTFKYFEYNNTYEGNGLFSFEDMDDCCTNGDHLKCYFTEYYGQWKDAKRHGRGKLIYKNEDSYHGDFKMNVKHGQGHQEYNTVNQYFSTYVGEFTEGYFHGKGTLNFSNGCSYNGNFKMGLINGKGKITRKNQDMFEGKWCDGIYWPHGTYIWSKNNAETCEYERWMGYLVNYMSNGSGKMYYKNGNICSGNFKNNLKHGNCTLRYWSQHKVFKLLRGNFEDDLAEGECYQEKQNGDVYEGEFVKGVYNGKGNYKYNNHVKYLEYDGFYKDGLLHPEGVLKYANGDVYEGQFNKGIIEGSGKYTYSAENPTYSYYIGSFKNNMFEDSGRLFYKNGNTYVGQFKNNQQVADESVCFFSERNPYGWKKYEGPYVDDFKCGTGKMMYINGDTYVGLFANDTFNGIGRFEGKEHNKTIKEYYGYWVDGKKEGFGKIEYKNGDMYRGNFKNDQFCEEGCITYKIDEKSTKKPDEICTKYEGSHLDGLPHGYGKKYFKDGSTFEGNFDKGLYHNEGTLTYSPNTAGNVLKYTGQFREGQRTGKGSVDLKNGDNYLGDWKNGKFYGFGTYTYSEKNPVKVRFEGYFRRGFEDGAGTEFYKEGYHIKAKWDEGKIVGIGEIIWDKEHPTEIKYVGEIHRGTKHGVGKQYYKNGDVFDGDWLFGKEEGLGTIYFDTNHPWLVKFVGTFKNGLSNGLATYHCKNGTIFEGDKYDKTINGTDNLKKNDEELYKMYENKYLKPINFPCISISNPASTLASARNKQQTDSNLDSARNPEQYTPFKNLNLQKVNLGNSNTKKSENKGEQIQKFPVDQSRI